MEKIRHKAIVVDIKGKQITLAFDDNNKGCSVCAIVAFCNLKKAQNIRINYKNTQNLKINDVVELFISEKAERAGIFLLYALPTAIIFFTLFVLKYFKFADEFCAEGALLSAGLYFLVLYLSKNRFNNLVEITREKNE